MFIEILFNKPASFLDFLGRLAMWPFRRPLWWIHRWLDKHVLERPGFWGNLWRLFHQPDWQRSSKFNARVWVVSFSVFWPLAHRFGHAWWINLGVTLLIDFVAYIFHKEWVWATRQIKIGRSSALWYSFTVLSFGINLCVAWALFNMTPIGNAPSKAAMGTVGVLINPLVFLFRKNVALRDTSQRTELA